MAHADNDVDVPTVALHFMNEMFCVELLANFPTEIALQFGDFSVLTFFSLPDLYSAITALLQGKDFENAKTSQFIAFRR